MFKAIIETSLGQRLLTLALALVLMLDGAMVLKDTPVDVFPDLNNHHPADRGRRHVTLKISHYINLCAFEGEVFGRPMIVRGSL